VEQKVLCNKELRDLCRTVLFICLLFLFYLKTNAMMKLQVLVPQS
jgi:hypothetical protein